MQITNTDFALRIKIHPKTTNKLSNSRTFLRPKKQVRNPENELPISVHRILILAAIIKKFILYKVDVLVFADLHQNIGVPLQKFCVCASINRGNA